MRTLPVLDGLIRIPVKLAQLDVLRMLFAPLPATFGAAGPVPFGPVPPLSFCTPAPGMVLVQVAKLLKALTMSHWASSKSPTVTGAAGVIAAVAGIGKGVPS